MNKDENLEKLINKSNNELNEINEIIKNFKSFITSVQAYSSAKSSKNYPLCVKKIIESEQKIKQILQIISGKIEEQNFKYSGFNEIHQLLNNEKTKLDTLEKELTLEFGKNISLDLEKFNLKIQGGDDKNGIRVKNFLLDFDKKNFNITVYYLFKKEKFVKIDGLNVELAAKKISEFYSESSLQQSQIEKSLELIYDIYSNLVAGKHNAKVEINIIMNEYFLKMNLKEKSTVEKRILFSYILFKINELNLKTNNRKSMKMNWATGKNITDRKIQLDIPINDRTLDSNNMAYLEFN